MMHTDFQAAHMRGGFPPFLPTVAPPENETGRMYPSQGCQPVSSSPGTAEHEVRPLIKLLMIGEDLRLTHSRVPILRACGFSVQCCLFRDIDRCLGARPQVVVFCQTVSAADAFRFATLFRSRESSVVLVRLSNAPQSEEWTYDVVLGAPIPPASLVSEMMKLRTTFFRGTEVPR